jgi:hypothetical protein
MREYGKLEYLLQLESANEARRKIVSAAAAEATVSLLTRPQAVRLEEGRRIFL